MIGNRYSVPDDIFMVFHPSDLTWKGISLVPGDIFEILEIYQVGQGTISNEELNRNFPAPVTVGISAIKINGIPYHIESVSVVTWCFLLLSELDYFCKLGE